MFYFFGQSNITRVEFMAKDICMMIIIGTNLNEKYIGSISGHHHDNYGCHPLTIMKTFHNYLIPSLLSPIQLHGYERPFHNLVGFNSTHL
jgi:hypothetical protein